jgi:hypothetical protein
MDARQLTFPEANALVPILDVAGAAARNILAIPIRHAIALTSLGEQICWRSKGRYRSTPVKAEILYLGRTGLQVAEILKRTIYRREKRLKPWYYAFYQKSTGDDGSLPTQRPAETPVNRATRGRRTAVIARG